MIETGRLGIINPPRKAPSFTTEQLERLAKRVSLFGERASQILYSPFNGEALGVIPICTPEDAQKAVQQAREAQAQWAKVDPKARARIMLRFHDLLLERQDEILDLTQYETGKVCARRATSTTRALRLASSRAVAFPIPLLAPLMMHRLPAIFITRSKCTRRH
jgi:hypothetical protein